MNKCLIGQKRLFQGLGSGLLLESGTRPYGRVHSFGTRCSGRCLYSKRFRYPGIYKVAELLLALQQNSLHQAVSMCEAVIRTGHSMFFRQLELLEPRDLVCPAEVKRHMFSHRGLPADQVCIQNLVEAYQVNALQAAKTRRAETSTRGTHRLELQCANLGRKFDCTGYC